MPVNVALIGLGRIGGSPALRLHAEPQVRLSGNDRDPDLAGSRGWLGQAHGGLPAVFNRSPSLPSTGEMLGRLVLGGLASPRGSFGPGG
ncbi:MAG: hypothetical protein IT318_21070 [Anaerolineales bacterium]|nr:hypothetical protein [Anaerolineales bacterium]